MSTKSKKYELCKKYKEKLKDYLWCGNNVEAHDLIMDWLAYKRDLDIAESTMDRASNNRDLFYHAKRITIEAKKQISRIKTKLEVLNG